MLFYKPERAYPYTCPIPVICGNGLLLRKAEDALLEDKLRVGGSHGLCRERAGCGSFQVDVCRRRADARDHVSTIVGATHKQTSKAQSITAAVP
jgi:hypothetical protein